jgi:hypothetical protein
MFPKCIHIHHSSGENAYASQIFHSCIIYKCMHMRACICVHEYAWMFYKCKHVHALFSGACIRVHNSEKNAWFSNECICMYSSLMRAYACTCIFMHSETLHAYAWTYLQGMHVHKCKLDFQVHAYARKILKCMHVSQMHAYACKDPLCMHMNAQFMHMNAQLWQSIMHVHAFENMACICMHF